MLHPTRLSASPLALAQVALLLSSSLLVACATEPESVEPTDEELIDAAIEKSTSSFDARQFDEMMTVYADDFRLNEDMDKESYREFLADLEAGGYLEDFRVDLSGVEVSVAGDTAEVDGVVYQGPGGTLDMTFRVEKRDGQWLFVEQTNVAREEGGETDAAEGSSEAGAAGEEPDGGE